MCSDDKISRFTRNDSSFTRNDSSFTRNDSSFTRNDSSFARNDSSFARNDSLFARNDKELTHQAEATRIASLGEVTAPKIDQGAPVGIGDFVYIDISSVNNKLKRITELKRLAIAAAPSRAKQHLKVGDVLVSMTRPSLNAVAIVPQELDGAIGSTGFHVLRAISGTEPRWLYYR